MERTELRSEATKLLRDVQYLQTWLDKKIIALVDSVFVIIIIILHVHLRDSLCDFEDPQQPDAPEDGEAEGSHGAG